MALPKIYVFLVSLPENWMNILLKKQESCVINDGFITKYFKLGKAAMQEDLISAYLFIHVLEIILLSIKKRKKYKRSEYYIFFYILDIQTTLYSIIMMNYV